MTVMVVSRPIVSVLVVIEAGVGRVWIQVMKLDSLLQVATATVVVAVASFLHVWYFELSVAEAYVACMKVQV